MRKHEDPCRDPASEARDDWEEREDAIRFSSVNRELSAKVARLERELEQERQLADRLAKWLGNALECDREGDPIPAADIPPCRQALADWRKSRNEAVDPP